MTGRLRKAYSTYAMCDEAYALTTGEQARTWSSRRILWMQFFLHLYWAGSSTADALPGSVTPDGVTGLDFALTALFTVLALDAVRDLRGDLPMPLLAVLSRPGSTPSSPQSSQAPGDGGGDEDGGDGVCRPASW